MEQTYTIETSYRIKYTNEKPVPIAEIIDSLVNIEKILKRTPKFIERYYKGISITSTEVFVSSIESGSLTEDYLIRFVFKTQKNYDDAKELIARIIGDNEVIKTLVTLGVGSMITWGIMTALPSGSEKSSIQAYDNVIINIGADVNFSAADIKATLEALPNKRALVKESVHAVATAKLDPNATIEMGENVNFTMPSSYVAQAPVNYEPPAPDERSTKYTNVEIFIYASDRDNIDKGWGGIVPELFDHRVRFILADTIDPSKLHGRTKARADLEVHEKFVREKKRYEVKMVEIHKIN